MAIYEQDPKTGLVAPFKGDQKDVKDALILFDSLDDEQIIGNMTSGVGTDTLFYRFPIKSGEGSKEVIGISVEGGYEIANSIRNLEVLNDYKIDKESEADYIYVGLRVKNLATNNTLLGMGRQCKFMIGRGNIPDHSRIDEHAFVKAISKAQRNGILHHADQRMLAQLIETWAKAGKGKLLAAPVSTGEQVKAQPPKQSVPPVVQAQKSTPAPVAKPIVTPSPTPAPSTPQASVISSAEAILKDAEAKITQLRVQVHNKFNNELGINAEKRKDVIKETFKDLNPVPDSLTNLSENQLNRLLEVADAMIKAKSGQPATVSKPTADQPVNVEQPATIQKTPLGFDSIEEQDALRKDLFAKLTSADFVGMSSEQAKKFLSDRGFVKSSDIPKDKLLSMFDEVKTLMEVKTKPIDF
ncbi:MAG: hypothetical protein WCY09_08990 [Candidatus Omnitrophota bacterium]|jgi:hypothetical protein